MQPAGCRHIPEHHAILQERRHAALLHLCHQAGHSLLLGLVKGDVALLIYNGQHQLFSHLARDPYRLHDILQRKGHAFRDDENIKLGGALSRMASPGIDAKIGAAGLDIVAALSQVFVDNIAKLKALFPRRRRLEKSLKVQLSPLGKHLDPGAVQEIGCFHQGEFQPFVLGPAKVALLIKIKQGSSAENNLIANKPAYYFFGH